MMARLARRQSESGYYHVMLRGINREFIFQDDVDKAFFMELIRGEQLTGTVALVTWCVMDNHAHMIVKAEKSDLAKAIKIISVKFAAHYNRGQKRIGPVFGDRFRSENIEDDAYLLGALRYIHQNPVTAKLAKDMAEYAWSSYHEYFGTLQYVDAAQKEFVLGLFGGDIERFAAFHALDDDIDYLETREQTAQNREDRAHRMIEQFCRANGIVSAQKIHKNPDLFNRLCRVLVHDAGLTLRKTAEHLSTTHQRVHEAVRD